MNKRVDQLREVMAEEGLDGFLVTDGMNRGYLSGFTGSSGALLLTADEAYIITDFRYFEQVGREAADWNLWKQRTNLDDAIAGLLKMHVPTRLGFEADAITVASWEGLKEEAPGSVEWVPTKGVVQGLRAVKSAEEIELIRRAQQITDEVAQQLPRLIQPGKQEKEVAWELEVLLRDLGADGPAFPITVASGSNSALPHYKPGERRIEPDEIVLVDFGAKLNGYHSDMTRTYFTGEPTEQYTRVYQIVCDALQKAEEELQAGYGAKAGDAIARDFISEHGHGDDFGHGLGHGVGLEIHELPTLSFRAAEDATLEVGNVVTIEPGIYLPGWGGIRIEDLALITEDGVEVLTQTPKEVRAWSGERGAEGGRMRDEG